MECNILFNLTFIAKLSIEIGVVFSTRGFYYYFSCIIYVQKTIHSFRDRSFLRFWKIWKIESFFGQPTLAKCTQYFCDSMYVTYINSPFSKLVTAVN